MLTALKGNDDYDGVVGAILESYYNLPKNGKPNLPNEFSVLASCFAIVEHGGTHYVKVLSMATGTKCLGRADCQQDMKDCRVRDCHAEVLSKRCLQRFLLKCQYNYLDELRRDLEHEAQARKSDLLVQNAHFPFEVLFRTRDRSVGASRDGRPSADRPVDVRWFDSPVLFRMKPQWQIGLFVSDPLCGDASIYPRREVGSSSSGTTSGGGAGPSPVAFTGAKLVGLRAAGREDAQALGAARTKSGRSDLPTEKRTSSMSCSDKVCRWAAAGMQGAALALLLPEPVALSAVLVAADEQAVPGAQQAALERCVAARLRLLGDCGGKAISVPVLKVYSASDSIALESTESTVGRAPLKFAEGKCCVEARSRREGGGASPKACPLSLNWVANAPGLGVDDGAADAVEQWHQSRQRRGPDGLVPAGFIRDRPLGSPDRFPSVRGGTLEVLLAQTGMLQGTAAKPKGKGKGKGKGLPPAESSLQPGGGSSLGKRTVDQLFPGEQAPMAEERVICSRLAPHSAGQLLTQVLETLNQMCRLQSPNAESPVAPASLLVDCSGAELYRRCKLLSGEHQRRLDSFLRKEAPFGLWCRGCGRVDEEVAVERD